MPITELLASIEPQPGPTVATVGTFDGVHLGHRMLLKRVKKEAKARNARSVVLVFKEQPKAFFAPEGSTSYLCDFEYRRSLLSEIGIDEIIELEFGSEIQQLSSDKFVSGLQKRIGLQALVVGPEAKIGSDRADIRTLVSRKYLNNIDFITAHEKKVGARTVSSSAIRTAISDGDCDLAAAMLGRNYAIAGIVAKGDRRGRTLGFPTANVEPEIPVTIPANGIYATFAEVGGKRYFAATSIGVRPTFEHKGEPTIEAYLLDFEEDLYTKWIRIEFVRRLRDEFAYESVAQLVEQMDRDVEQTRQILESR